DRPASPVEPRSVLGSGKSLESGDALVAANGLSRLTVLPSGNVVLTYHPVEQQDPRRADLALQPSDPKDCDTWECLVNQPRDLWSTETDGHPGAHLTMQTDGDLQVIDGTTVVWSSKTSGAPGA